MILFEIAKRFKRHRVVKTREGLLAIHRNDPNPIRRLFGGLCYLTFRDDAAKDLRCEFPLNGSCELSCNNIDIVTGRLTSINLSWSSAQLGGKWNPLPDSLSRDNDRLESRWLDRYFLTTDEEDVYDKFVKVKQQLSVLSSPLLEANNPTDVILGNQTAHLIRELTVLVEHFITVNSK